MACLAEIVSRVTLGPGGADVPPEKRKQGCESLFLITLIYAPPLSLTPFFPELAEVKVR
jgi:hypothetical protein